MKLFSTPFARFSLLTPFILGLVNFSVFDSCAADLTFRWATNSGPNIAGYYFHYGPSSRGILNEESSTTNGTNNAYPNTVNVGNTGVFTLTNLTASNKYYFAVTAYGPTNGVESNFSAELSAVPGSHIVDISFGTNVQVGFTSVNGWRYELERRATLSDAWIPNVKSLTATNTVSRITDTLGTTFSFYRLKFVPQ